MKWLWTWGGSSTRWISADEEGFVTFLKKCHTDDNESCYLVWKRYYFLKSSPDVKRMIILEGKITCASVMYCTCMQMCINFICLVVGYGILYFCSPFN